MREANLYLKYLINFLIIINISNILLTLNWEKHQYFKKSNITSYKNAKHTSSNDLEKNNLTCQSIFSTIINIKRFQTIINKGLMKFLLLLSLIFFETRTQDQPDPNPDQDCPPDDDCPEPPSDPPPALEVDSSLDATILADQSAIDTSYLDQFDQADLNGDLDALNDQLTQNFIRRTWRKPRPIYPDKSQWPKLKGKNGDYAVRTIRRENPSLKVSKVLQGSFITLDIRYDRVRVWVDQHNIVTKTPFIG